MGILLDTHAVLWYVSASPHLSERARALIDEPGTEVFVSAASVWELSIKIGKGKLSVAGGLETMVSLISNAGWKFCSVGVDEAMLAGSLPAHHNDPFDRMLVSQALVHGLDLVSADAALDQYGVSRIW